MSQQARAYAKALLEQTPPQEQTQAVEQFRYGVDLLTSDEAHQVNGMTVLNFLSNSAIDLTAKQDVLYSAFGEFLPTVKSLFSLMLEQNMLSELTAVSHELKQAQLKQQGASEAEVWSSVSLPESSLNHLKHQLQHIFSLNDLDLTLHVDPSLLGGLIMQVGDQRIDLSYRGRLDALAAS